MWYLIALAALVAVALVVGAYLVGLRRGTTGPAAPEQPSAAERALARATAGYVVLAADGSVVLTNESAHHLGIIEAGIVDPRIVDRAMERLTESPVNPWREDVWESAGEPGRPEILRLAALALGPDLVLVTATDETAIRRADTVRRDFVANVSHELKSPVTALGLLAEAVEQAAESPEVVRSFAERMHRESTRLGTLISELIALSAIQDGTLDEADLVLLDEVVRDAVDRVAVTASAKGIVISVDQDSGATVLGDRSLLTTAVGNLVENAVNYSGQGSTVTVSRVLRRGQADIAVADRGIGIAPEDRQRIFERFFRADPARSRATGGTGLGLAIVKHVASTHHGSIRVHSKLGVGSTFTLRLPLVGPDTELGSGTETTEEAVAP